MPHRSSVFQSLTIASFFALVSFTTGHLPATAEDLPPAASSLETQNTGAVPAMQAIPAEEAETLVEEEEADAKKAAAAEGATEGDSAKDDK